MNNFSIIIYLILFFVNPAHAVIFYPDHRKTISTDSYPFRAMVKVHPYEDDLMWCSGFLIGPNLVKTSKHCLKDLNHIPFSKMFISITSNKYPDLKQTYKVLNSLDIDEVGDEAYVDDDYTLIIDGDLGNVLGYFGHISEGLEVHGFAGSLESPKFAGESEFCKDSNIYPRKKIDQLLSKAKKRANKSIVKTKNRFLAKHKTCSASYPIDKGVNTLSIEDDCSIVGVTNAAVGVNCSAAAQSSGSPLFYRKGNAYFAYAVLKGERRPASLKNINHIPYDGSMYNIATLIKAIPLLWIVAQ